MRNIIAAGLTDQGLQREYNEDSFCTADLQKLFVVADGMGGHRAGNVASQMATAEILSFFENTTKEDSTWPFDYDPDLSLQENRLITGIRVANKKIFDLSCRDRSVHGMGTTVVGICFSEDLDKTFIAHVGDSRAYRVRAGEISQLTRDHSLINDYLMVMPDMTQQQQEELPKNVITRALGMQDSVLVDLHKESLEVGDCFVLCSDGLSGMVSDEQILQIVSDHGVEVETAAKALIDMANANGGEDNVTAIVIAVAESQ